MSTEFRMILVMNLLCILFSAAVVPSDQCTVPIRSFKRSENVTYDCLDIYKQPGLDHPLLKTHKIQMKPSFSRPGLNNLTGDNKPNKNKIECPEGSVPILRNTKKMIENSELFAEKYFHPLSLDSPGTHIAGIRSSNGPFRGVEAQFNSHNLNVGKDQASYSQIYIGSGLNNQTNFISAGFMINPGFFPDGRVWSYGFWKGKDGKGCYNTACSGFIQVSKVVPIVKPIDLKPEEFVWSHCSIHQDKNTGNWWITQLMPKEPNVDIGYWPKELFDLLNNGANMVGVGGVAQASRSGSSPPMGDGRFPNTQRLENSANFSNIHKERPTSMFSHIKVLNSKFEQSEMGDFYKLLDSTKCYGLQMGGRIPFIRFLMFGFHFYYGGPGGNSCGI